MTFIDFGGVSTNVKKAKSFKTVFPICTNYSDSAFYETKKVYKHEEEGFNFNYKYIVRVEDLYELSGEDELKGKVSVELYLVPTEDSMSEKTKNKIRESFGYDEDDIIYLADIIDYGLGVRMGYETVENVRYLDGTKVHSKLNEIATVLDTIDSMRGFYLDKAWNLIGTNGWDVLKEMLFDKDFIKSSFDRIKSA